MTPVQPVISLKMLWDEWSKRYLKRNTDDPDHAGGPHKSVPDDAKDIQSKNISDQEELQEVVEQHPVTVKLFPGSVWSAWASSEKKTKYLTYNTWFWGRRNVWTENETNNKG